MNPTPSPERKNSLKHKWLAQAKQGGTIIALKFSGGFETISRTIRARANFYS
jgi:hypothetical protein